MAKKTDNRPMWAGDCETDPFKHRRVPKDFIWGLYTGAGYHEFTGAEDFVNAVKDEDVIIVFHNGGRFDFHMMLQFIKLGVEIKVINGRLVIANIGKAEIRDSWNILPVPLATFGGKLEIEYAKLEAKVRARHMPEIRKYLREDCVSLWHAVNEFENLYGRHLTLAGAAMAQWKKISGLKAPSSDKAFFDKFSRYYFGGRVSTFQTGVIEGPGKVYDINSAYPWAMLSEHPYDPEYIEFDHPRTYLDTSMVTVDCVSMGALPWRDDDDNIVFPCDSERRRYYVTGHELRAAQETFSVKHVELIQAIDFIGLQDFKPYMYHFYDIKKRAKKENNTAQYTYAKLFMTNLYGKFCANPENYGNFICVPFADMTAHVCRCRSDSGCYCHVKDGGKWCDCERLQFDGMIGPHALLRAPLEEWQEHYLNVATGASITGQVRSKLWRAIKAAENPIYCDTDSLICTQADVELGVELGQWEQEGEWDRAHIGGKKMYLLEGRFAKGKRTKSASKGVNLKASDIRDRVGKKVETPEYIGYTAVGKKIAPDDAIANVAKGNISVFNAEAPTFSVRTKPRFQTRQIRKTGQVHAV